MHPKVDALLSRFPRITLIPWETPIQYLPRISRELGVDVYVKRDDLTGLGIGGNKIRKLEFLLGDALSRGCDTVITIGAVHSNHAFVTALAAKKLGLGAVLILRGEEVLKGNYLLDKLMGIETRIYEADNSWELMKVAEEVAEELKGEGKKPYIIPPGGASPVGTLGYIRGVGELYTQVKKLGLRIDTVVDAVGSGGTYAGLLLGSAIVNAEWSVVGIDVSSATEKAKERVKNLVEKTKELLGINVKVQEPRIYDYGFGAYGKIVKEVAKLIKSVGTMEGLLLDPVYTGKAFYGLMDLAKKGDLGESVLFIHTGGLPGIFHYGEEMLELLV
ncbi:pyridoxal-phosphate dependent enzyme [Pyrococcus abyssi]|uniref:Putative 1-aminocyclopropane-1-carboxylate deaminase n=1 Tax=Pyrococcus abyssi (strain GE5 / Orsay) TaxID=272844 RepID=1A1D_PYRAB|nr:pyridoxal-phosphate dependent enzyme [Pyrococcus abyssi]Q9V2L2.1 RecName: Full=Putative 1-aminocyclopropane-1-carboxylate deaminase; Short=ACC deaminase [Pyrococcus abyssi GE5]CAB48986.1 Putative 1-aminocyclopropane-1-carboxylate deaminase (EC 4.1.99.4) (ACC deaminase) [Pyrococcus abyssi GE5]CCE69435.1 TPA: D-cysteine desulfhydrase [Pyrococcus abyssi GE5]